MSKIDKDIINSAWIYAISVFLIFYLAFNFSFHTLLWQTINRILPLTTLLTLIFVFIVNDNPNGLNRKVFLKNMRVAFKYSILIVFGLELINLIHMYLLGNNAIMMEKYKNGDNNEKGDEEDSENDNVGDFLNEVKDDIEKDEDRKKNNVNNLLDEYVSSMSKADNLNDDEYTLINDNDEDDDDGDIDSSLINYKKIKSRNKSAYTPARAQRETYKLIDTVKQLEDTMKNLGPSLKMGHKIMRSMEKYGFHNKNNN